MIMRKPQRKEDFTPFGLWIPENCKSSRDGLSVSNLDYVFEDFKKKRLMLVEEKRYNGALYHAQRLTFKVLDKMLRQVARSHGYDYWGFYLVVLAKELPEDGVRLNGNPVSVDQLIKHLNFEVKACDPMTL